MEDHTNKRVVTDIKDRLKRIGIHLDQYPWTFNGLVAGVTGFYFTCSAYQKLINAAEESRKTEVSFEGLPSNDLWAKQLVQHAGYIEKDVPDPIALDFSLKNLGECRAYYVPLSVRTKGEAHRKAQVDAANEKSVYREIARRLAGCNPPVILDDHIGRIQKIGDTTLDGVNFIARDYKKLKQILVDAKDGSGAPFFGHAILENDDHWALKLSFLVTDGTGFREVTRLKMKDRGLFDAPGASDRRDQRNVRRQAVRFAGTVPDELPMPDLTSLHCAVSFQGCNIHIDDSGFVISDALGNTIVDPDLLQHIVNELIFKTYGKYILPEGIVKRVNLVLPTTLTDFNRVGVSVDAYKTQNFKISVSGTCSVFGPHECAATVSLSGRF
jgi:hypothetical protein